MAIKKREETITATVIDPNAHVYLSISIGNAQIGGTIVKWSDEQDNLDKGKIKNLDLGIGSNIQGRTLDLMTNILDVNKLTNGVVVTYYFHNAVTNPPTLTDEVDNHGDIFTFLTHVKIN